MRASSRAFQTGSSCHRQKQLEQTPGASGGMSLPSSTSSGPNSRRQNRHASAARGVGSAGIAILLAALGGGGLDRNLHARAVAGGGDHGPVPPAERVRG